MNGSTVRQGKSSSPTGEPSWQRCGPSLPAPLPARPRPEPRAPRTTCSAFRMATLMEVEKRREMTEQSAARRLVSCAVSVASKNATGWRMRRPNSWLLRGRWQGRGEGCRHGCKRCKRFRAERLREGLRKQLPL